MDTMVLKFGGSSLADNTRLNIVANKIKEFYKKENKIVVVVSAQGKTTDNFIKEALSISKNSTDRELDVLLSSGEQISMAKLAILLNKLKMPAVSLTGWQAGIITNKTNQDASIEDINTSRIEKELEKGKIVIVAGFQGINENNDITTLGRGGSDTTAVALAAKLKATKCYIFSDVDGVYSTDPKQINTAKKINALSYKEMTNISEEGAKVLQSRCVQIGEKYNIPIIAKSTFNNNKGTIISNKLEGESVKNIVKNDKLINVNLFAKEYSLSMLYDILNILINNDIIIKNLINKSKDYLNIYFITSKEKINKITELLKEKKYDIELKILDITRISIIGNELLNKRVLKNILKIIEKHKLKIITMDFSAIKISIVLNEIVKNDVVQELHEKLIQKSLN